MIFVLFPIKLRFFKNKFFIEQRRHSKHISDGEYMYDKINCLRSYFYNFFGVATDLLLLKIEKCKRKIFKNIIKDIL